MRAVTPLFLILTLGGCASATPGFSPDGPPNLPAQLKPFNGGAVDKAGHYAVTADERALSCSKLTGSMQVVMSRLKDSGNVPKPSSATTSMQAIAKPFIGGGTNLDTAEEMKQARARLKAYNELLAEKKCKTLDIGGV